MWPRVLLACWLVVTVCVEAQDDEPFYFPDDESLQNPAPTTTVKPKIKPQTTPLKSNGKSLQMCKKYAEEVYLKIENFGHVVKIDTCSLVEPLITNGTAALPREFPHMALIGFQSRLGIQWKCGGSLISERFVLSAAHCNPLNPKRVRLGDYNIRSQADEDSKESASVEYSIIQVIQHPQYNEKKSFNDITLYRLDRNVVFNEYIRPICLHTEYNIPRTSSLISGWGATEFGGPKSDILLKGNVSYVSSRECYESLNPVLKERESEVRDNMMVCAANFVNGTDTCQGDSGGPLQFRLEDPYCMYSQVGITSFGVKCGFEEGQAKYPAVYTRVSNYVPWIESIVWK